jgi:hypothetical protein
VASAAAIQLKMVDGPSKMLRTDRALSVEYGYAATGHSAQGLGADRVLLDRDAKARTTDHRSLYTDQTRTKHKVVAYTNDRSILPHAVVRQSQKTAALDVVRVHQYQSGEKQAASTTKALGRRRKGDIRRWDQHERERCGSMGRRKHENVQEIESLGGRGPPQPPRRSPEHRLAAAQPEVRLDDCRLPEAPGAAGYDGTWSECRAGPRSNWRELSEDASAQFPGPSAFV